MEDMKTRGAYRRLLAELFPDSYESKKVNIIHGAPGSGKTTYVQTHKSDDDLVVDLDYICAALNATSSLYQDHGSVLSLALRLREHIFETIECREGKWKTAWVITATPDSHEVQRLATRLRGEVISMDTSREQCIQNIRSDTRRKGKTDHFVRLAEDWYTKNCI